MTKKVLPCTAEGYLIWMKRAESALALLESIERVIELEEYAVQTLYPGDNTPVDDTEYREACQIALLVNVIWPENDGL